MVFFNQAGFNIMSTLASSPATMMRPGVGVGAGSFAGGLVCEIPGGFWVPEVLLDVTFCFGVDASMLSPGQSITGTLSFGSSTLPVTFSNLPQQSTIRGWLRIKARDQGGGNIDLSTIWTANVWDAGAFSGYAPAGVMSGTGNTFGVPTLVDFILSASDDAMVVYPTEFCITTPQF